jgi:D-xylonolactonase
VLAEGVSISNGMGWSPDLKTFYYTDSTPKQVYAYDYSPRKHTISNKRVFVQLGDDLGVPDGMTVDAEGFVWSANWGGGCVIRFDPDGKEERRIEMPATQSSSVMFGGPDFTDIYVTSANAGTGEPPGQFMPKGYDNSKHRGGELYVIRQDEVRGKPEFEADLKWPE